MNNVFQGKLPPFKIDKKSPLHQSDILPGSIKQRHIDGIVLQTGLIADRPDGTTETKAYFATDENKLYVWNESSEVWVGVTLS